MEILVLLKSLKIKTINKELLGKKSNIVSVVYPLGLMFIVLGSIIFGVASPTEAAGIGALGATLIALFYRKLNQNEYHQLEYSNHYFYLSFYPPLYV